MQLNCETEELRQMALLIFGDKITFLEQKIEEQDKAIARKDLCIEGLKQTIADLEEKIELQQKQLTEMSLKMNDTVITTWMLQQYLVLSLQKAMVYAGSVDNGVRAQLGQFMFQSLPDNAPPVLLECVRKVTQPTPAQKSGAISVEHADINVNSPGNTIAKEITYE